MTLAGPHGTSSTTRRGKVGSSKVLAWLAWVSVCFFWGTTFPAIHVMVQAMPPMLSAGLRQGIAGAVLLLLCLALRLKFPAPRHWLELGWAGFLIVTVANGLAALALRQVQGGMATLLAATGALWVVCLEALRRDGQKPGLREGAGLLLGFFGLWVLIQPGAAGPLLPVLLMVFVAFCNANGYVYLKHHEVEVQPLVSTGIQLFTGGALLSLAALTQGERLHAGIPRTALGAFWYLVVFGSMLGYFSFVYMMKRLPPALAVLYVYINPLVAVAISGLWMGEAITARFWVGGAVILSGVALVQDLPSKMVKQGLSLLGYD